VKYSSELIQSMDGDEDEIIKEIIVLMKTSKSFQYEYHRKHQDGRNKFHVKCLIEIFDKFTISIILEAKIKL
jgi:hypothetical protein